MTQTGTIKTVKKEEKAITSIVQCHDQFLKKLEISCKILRKSIMKHLNARKVNYAFSNCIIHYEKETM